MKQTAEDVERYRANYLREREGIALYRALASAEKDEQRSSILNSLADTEEKHAARWASLIEEAGLPVPPYRPGWRVRAMTFLSRHLGSSHFLPVMSSIESRSQGEYAGQIEAAGMPADERKHRRTVHALQHPPVPQVGSVVERWHRTSYGGSLRAAVFGANDGLLSNFSLLMGVAAANPDARFVAITGIAGLLAGAFSMAAGEWVSVRSQRELYEQQIALEAQELESSPEEEHAELALIYQAKGIPKDQAEELATRILSNPATAIDTLAREELGLDPESLGSPAGAALSSFAAFAAGASIPVVPFVLSQGNTAIAASAIVCGTALFGVGAAISLFTGKGVIFSGGRMVLIGAAASGTTYLIGKLLGVSIGG